MKRLIIIVLVSIFLLNFQKIEINANNKRDVPYEINNISINKSKKHLVIDGWGFITDAQHFKGSSTHRYSIQLKAGNHTVNSSASIRNISHTDTMFLIGSRWCKNKEYNKLATECNHHYDNIGFRFSIPLSKLKMNREYVATLKIDALQSKTSKSISIYFPVKKKLVLKDNKKNYIVDSKLNDMSLKVLFTHVLVRDKAGKAGKIKQTKRKCSQNKSLYYQQSSRFNNIHDKVLLNNLPITSFQAKR